MLSKVITTVPQSLDEPTRPSVNAKVSMIWFMIIMTFIITEKMQYNLQGLERKDPFHILRPRIHFSALPVKEGVEKHPRL